MHRSRYRPGYQPEDENQDTAPPTLPYDDREAKVKRVTRFLATQRTEVFKPLAEPSCGVLDPHYKARWEAAERLARMLIPR